mmetsp:Transcript_10523/g.16471  ORF Transcript_10523/g.16471 Transcript_10523/m.16471 type:complete len:173 (-) Transcript_10523:462-980(-)
MAGCPDVFRKAAWCLLALSLLCFALADCTGGDCKDGKCPYKNGKALKELRAQNPYELLATGADEPTFDEESGSMSIAVAWNSSCLDEEPKFTAEHLEGGPMSVVMPIRAAESCAAPAAAAQRRTGRVTIAVPPVSLQDKRAMFLSFPEGSEFEIWMLRPEIKGWGDNSEPIA